MTRAIKHIIVAQGIRTLYFAGPIWSLFLLGKGLTLQQILSLTSILMISGMIFEIPTGVFGDRFGRKWSMTAGAAVSVVAWFLWLYTDSLLGFMALYALFGLANSFWSGSDQAFIIDELKAAGKEALTQKVFSIYGSLMNVAYGIAALVGGLLSSVHAMENYYLLYQLTFATSVIGFIATLLLKESRHTSVGDAVEHVPESVLAGFSSGIRLLRTNRKLRKIVLYFMFTAMPGFALMELFQVYFTHAHVPDSWFGPALAASAWGIAAVKWYSYKIEEWFGVERGLFIATLIPIVLFGLMGAIFHPVVAVILFIMTDAANNVRDPLIADYQNRHIQGAHRATVLSTISLLLNLFVALLQPITGTIADHSLSAAFFFTAVMIAVGAVFFRISKEYVTV